MKRKKWTEEEESTLISTYAELQRSGALSKLKKREKKFEPIAQRLNAVHHNSNPTSFPFRWTWHDVSVKVQNMRHQFLNVKQKIRILSPTSDSASFNWAEGESHWQNFLKYKDVFGDLDLDPDPALPPRPPLPPSTSNDAHHSNGGDGDGDDDDDDDDGDREDDKDQVSASASALLVVDDEEAAAAAAVLGYDGFVDGDGPDVLGMGLGMDCEDGFEGDRDEEELEPAVSNGCEDGENGELGFVRAVNRANKRRKDWGGGRVLELREMMLRREERRREREFRREEEEAGREDRRREKEREKEELMSGRELELWERERMWVGRESERRMRVELELEEEKLWRMKLEEKREEEEMEWRERMVGMQLEHEKKMMEMHAEACHNQMQVLGVLMRLVGQFFGAGGDGLEGAMGGGLPLQNLQQQHPGSLVGENGKADGNSGAHFM